MSFLKNIFGSKEEPVATNKDFWNWFQQNEKSFFNVIKNQGRIEKDFFDKISPKLNNLNDGLFLVTGMCDENTAELVITAEGVTKNIVFIEELIAAAPKIEDWRFTALKPPLDIKDVTIKMADYEFGKNNINFYVNERNEFPDEINITVVHDDFNDENKDVITNGTFIFLDNYLGELNFVTTIDQINVKGKEGDMPELIPIEKLKNYLIWREKEFPEKYGGVWHHSEENNYHMMEATLENGNPLIAIINNDLLEWDGKASHPWVLIVEVPYKEANNGMPDESTYQLLGEMEDKILEALKDSEGYLNVGRQTANGIREIYFCCKDFRKPSKVLHSIQKEYKSKLNVQYDFYKDKYWQSLDRFRKTVE